VALRIPTDWSVRWGTPSYFTPGPFLTRETSEHLLDKPPIFVGIDCASIDIPKNWNGEN
jgi:kynurenine formamidase